MKKHFLFCNAFISMLLMMVLLNCNSAYAQNSCGNVTDYDDEIIQMPQVKASFPGGGVELINWLKENVQYPENARNMNIQGTVVVKFVVEKDGSISQPKIESSVHEMLDEEALRLVKSMPKWTPAKNNGMPCRSHYLLPIQFYLQ